MMETAIRLLFRNSDGNIEDTSEEFSLDLFGGTIPSVGDLIINPGCAGDRSDPANRTIWEVRERYVQPETVEASRAPFIGIWSSRSAARARMNA